MSQWEEDAGMAGDAYAAITGRLLGELDEECPICEAESGKTCASNCSKAEYVYIK